MSDNNDGYVKYLESRLALAEENLRKQGVFGMPTMNIVSRLWQVPVGSVIVWEHRYPRGDVYKFVAFLQKSNEWHIVSGRSKRVATHEGLVQLYSNASITTFKVLS